MTINDWTAILVAIAFILLLMHVPLFKPWFGFRKPRGHKGHWFE